MNLVDITCDTPLEDILDHSSVLDITENINRVSPIMKVVYNRASCLENGLTCGGLSADIKVQGDIPFNKVGQQIYDEYDNIFSTLPQVADGIDGEACKRENFELNALARKLHDKIDSLSENYKNTTFDDDNEDDQVKKRAMQMDISKYEAKLEVVQARLSKVPLSGTGTGTKGGSTAAGAPTYLFDTGNDDNNKAYGADCSSFGMEDLKKIISNGYRFNSWKLGDNRLGLNGEILGKNSKYYGLGNNYYVCEYNGKKVYIICSDTYNSDSSDTNMRQSSPILYITEDDNGHKLCYDKSGNAVSYNTAMNIMDVDKCSYYGSQGSVTSYPKVGDFSAKIETNTNPTPFAPSQYNEVVMDGDGGSTTTKTWRSSEEDSNGDAWKSYSNNTFDNSKTFEDVDLSGSFNNYEVYRKDKGDMGKINVLLKDNNSHGKYFSIEQPDGTYLYYDSNCNPVTDQEVLDHII